MKKWILGALAAAIAMPGLADAPASAQRHDDRRWDDRRAPNARWGRDEWRNGRHYDWNRPDRRHGAYDPARYYRDGRYYKERRLTRADRIYRGYDGRYYCRRDDGTTGLIIGGIAGGALGNAIANGGSNTLGTLLGAGLGAVLGQQIDRGNVRCR